MRRAALTKSVCSSALGPRCRREPRGGAGDEGGEAGAAVMSANSLSFTGGLSLQLSAFSAETSEEPVPGELWGVEKV